MEYIEGGEKHRREYFCFWRSRAPCYWRSVDRIPPNTTCGTAASIAVCQLVWPPRNSPLESRSERMDEFESKLARWSRKKIEVRPSAGWKKAHWTWRRYTVVTSTWLEMQQS